MNYKAETGKVKKYGRTWMHDDILWCGLSGSGIGFTCMGTRVAVTIAGDDTTYGNETEGKARIAVYVNGIRVVDDMVTRREQTYEVFASTHPQQAEIQVLKISECAMSVMGIAGIETDAADGIFPLPEKKRKIEFIGDSITCGYGVDMEDPEVPFATEYEDVTRAYAYKVAQKLDADYSMVSYSGYGVISGYTEEEVPDTKELVPTYYNKVGFSYAHPYGTTELSELPWDFTQFVPQVIVVNLGTNDDSYCKDDPMRQQQFSEKYTAFLEQIRQYNPQAAVLCTVGMMGERIYPAVEEAVQQYCLDHPGSPVYAMPLTEQEKEDGLASDSHPTERTHEKAAEKVAAKIREIMEWQSI